MKNLFSFALLWLIPAVLFSQGPSAEWANTFNVLGNDEAWKIISLSDGSMVITGSAETDGFLMKLDRNGNQLWLHTYGGDELDEFRGGTQKQDGSGFILVGFTRSYSSSGDNDVWIVETDNDGNLVNQWNYGRTSMYDNAYDIRPTSDGGYIIFGDSEKSIQDDWDIYLLKLNADLSLEWSTTIGSTNRERGYTGVEMIDGGFLIAGETGQPFQQDDVYLLKTDENGNKVWEKTYGGEYDEEAFCLQITPDRNYVASGQTWSWGTHNGYADMFLMKMDSAGNTLWPGTVAAFGGEGGEDDSGHGVLVTADNDYSEVGDTQKFTGSFRAWLVKADSGGNQEWESYYEMGSGETYFNSIDLAPDNKYIMAGYAGSDVFVVQTETDTSLHNHPPVAQPDTFTTVQNNSTTLSVLDNDNDPDGDALTILWVTIPGLQGTVEISSDQQSLIYTPPNGFEGTEQFSYTAGDGKGGMAKCRVVVNVSGASIVNAPQIVKHDMLFKAYPNPFNPTVNLEIWLPYSGFLQVEIFNIRGEKVVSLFRNFVAKGRHLFAWDGVNENNAPLAGGVYLVQARLRTNDRSANLVRKKKILLIK